MYKYELLRLLDDAEIQRKILKIVNEPNVFEEPQEETSETRQTINEEIPAPDDNAEKISAAQQATDTERLLNSLRGEYLKLRSDFAQSEQRIKSLERKLQTALNENSRLNKSLEQTQKRAQDKISRLESDFAQSEQRVKELEQQIQTAQYKNSRLENSLSQSEQSARSLQDKLKEWQGTFNREQQRAENLKRDLDDAQDKISELEEQLQQRFARGWELFKKYQRVGSHARQLLQGVFPREDFMSFICGGAQINSLETLWDVLRECIMSNRQQDAEILWQIFEYCLELVNSSKAQAGYSILPVNVGDRFDSDVHSEGPGSRAQGKISNIYLLGYRNDYNGKIIRKSIVKVS